MKHRLAKLIILAAILLLPACATIDLKAIGEDWGEQQRQKDCMKEHKMPQCRERDQFSETVLNYEPSIREWQKDSIVY
jgi:hypothetical protein